MSAVVSPLIGHSISHTIASLCGPLLSVREGEIFDYCQTLGEVWMGFVDGDFVCCWGLIPPTFLSNQAYLWMWAPEPIKHQFIFVRQSQLQIERMLQRFDSIVGHCLVTARSAQRWLKWLGAEFDAPQGDTVAFTIRRRE